MFKSKKLLIATIPMLFLLTGCTQFSDIFQNSGALQNFGTAIKDPAPNLAITGQLISVGSRVDNSGYDDGNGNGETDTYTTINYTFQGKTEQIVIEKADTWSWENNGLFGIGGSRYKTETQSDTTIYSATDSQINKYYMFDGNNDVTFDQIKTVTSNTPQTITINLYNLDNPDPSKNNTITINQ